MCRECGCRTMSLVDGASQGKPCGGASVGIEMALGRPVDKGELSVSESWRESSEHED